MTICADCDRQTAQPKVVVREDGTRDTVCASCYRRGAYAR